MTTSSVALAVIVGACGGAPATPNEADGSAAAGIASLRPVPAQQAATPRPAATTRPPAIALVRTGGSSAPRIVAVDARAARIVADLPDGPVAPDGSAVFAIRGIGPDTEIAALTGPTWAATRYRTLPGRWAWPTMGADLTPIGLDSDGTHLVLVARDRPGDRSRFAVLPASLDADPTYIDLAGSFDVDGLAPGGGSLYLVERRDGRDYAIRSVDVASGRLATDPVVDKREGDEAMVGQAIGRVVSSGWLHTLYRAEEPFLHSLDAANRFTFCVELDPVIASSSELALALTPDGGLGWIVDVDGARIEPINAAEGLAGPAKAFRGDGGPTGATGATTAMGATPRFDPSIELHGALLLGTTSGLVRLDPATAVARVLAPGHVSGLGRASSGAVAVVFSDRSVQILDR
ncbi:MAG TPA: hypothetical protein VFS32_08240 [Candidatus Limnocylindrales bacterium]|nr:hypothetical protein [Candidatus Limnocylindrales bacterium]